MFVVLSFVLSRNIETTTLQHINTTFKDLYPKYFRPNHHCLLSD